MQQLEGQLSLCQQLATTRTPHHCHVIKRSATGATQKNGGMRFGPQGDHHCSRFQITVMCAPRAAGTSSAVSIGMYARAADAPPDASYTLTFEMSAAPQEARPATSGPLKGTGIWGFETFFKVGPMAGGWDEAAWVAKGLPANGPLVLKLSVSKVGHMGKPLR